MEKDEFTAWFDQDEFLWSEEVIWKKMNLQLELIKKNSFGQRKSHM